MTAAITTDRAALQQLARELYEDNANRVKPSWDMLGETTRSVWVDLVIAGKKPVNHDEWS